MLWECFVTGGTGALPKIVEFMIKENYDKKLIRHKTWVPLGLPNLH